MLKFWIYNKQTGFPAIAGSLQAVSVITGISINKLYHHYQKGLLEIEVDHWKVSKIKVYTSTTAIPYKQ